MGPLALQFVVSTLMLVLCVIIHGLGLAGLNRALRTEASIERMQRINPLSPLGLAFTLLIVLTLIALHGVEIWAFAALYVGLGAIPRLEDTLYFSTISFRRWDTTISTSCRSGGCWGLLSQSSA